MILVNLFDRPIRLVIPESVLETRREFVDTLASVRGSRLIQAAVDGFESDDDGPGLVEAVRLRVGDGWGEWCLPEFEIRDLEPFDGPLLHRRREEELEESDEEPAEDLEYASWYDSIVTVLEIPSMNRIPFQVPNTPMSTKSFPFVEVGGAPCGPRWRGEQEFLSDFLKRLKQHPSGPSALCVVETSVALYMQLPELVGLDLDEFSIGLKVDIGDLESEIWPWAWSYLTKVLPKPA